MSIARAAAKHSVTFFVGLGALGGFLLVATKSLTTRGPIVFIPYAILILMCAAFIRFADGQSTLRRFQLSFYAFMTATAILYIFVATVATGNIFKISLLGHVERVALVTVIGVVVSAIIALSGGEAPGRTLTDLPLEPPAADRGPLAGH